MCEENVTPHPAFVVQKMYMFFFAETLFFNVTVWKSKEKKARGVQKILLSGGSVEGQRLQYEGKNLRNLAE
jgi:hypothetical protein